MQGFTLWFTGLSGAGKSTLAEAVRDVILARGGRVEVLDGDEVRTNLSKGLGFSKKIATPTFAASATSRGCCRGMVLSPSLRRSRHIATCAPKYAALTRRPLSKRSSSVPSTNLSVRDKKGLYAKALRGEIKNFTGVSDPYEPPASAEVHLHSDRERVEESRDRIIDWLEQKGLLFR